MENEIGDFDEKYLLMLEAHLNFELVGTDNSNLIAGHCDKPNILKVKGVFDFKIRNGTILCIKIYIN